MLLRTTPFTCEKSPPMMTFPSGCTAVARTTPTSNTCAIDAPEPPPPLGGASCTAWPLFTLIMSGAVSTASKLDPAIERSWLITASDHPVSDTPCRYQSPPGLARTRPYVLNARSTVCVCASKPEMSNEALRRKRAPMGGRFASAAPPAPCRAGHTYAFENVCDVTRIACAISPAATSS